MDGEGELERSRSAEESDQLARSKKKMKCAYNGQGIDLDLIAGEEMELEDSHGDNHNRGLINPSYGAQSSGMQRPREGLSYRDTLQKNNPDLSFSVVQNPFWEESPQGEDSDDDEPPEVDDPHAPLSS